MNEPQSKVNYKILGYNLLAFVIYTIGLISMGGNSAIIAFILACIHFVICIIQAIVEKKWIWLLSGLLILLIGFGTCVNFIKLDLR